MEGLTRGQLAQRVGINLETVRFYEKEGLLSPAARTASGYRQFAETTVNRLEFVKRAKELGFSLAEIRELLVLQDEKAHCCVKVRDQLQQKLADVLAKKTELERLEVQLHSALRQCNHQLMQPALQAGAEHAAECPVLQQMAGSVRPRSR